MVFHVIAVTAGLAAAARSRAVEAGPPFVASEANYSTLLDIAGFTRIQITDDSGSYRDTAAAWLHEWAREAEVLEALFGPHDFRERQDHRRAALDAIDRGLLKRYRIASRAGPGPGRG